MDRTNWAGNHRYAAARLHEPESIDELRTIVRATPSLKALGSRHSFNDIADTTGDHLSLARMPRVFELDAGTGTITIDGGVRYGDLCAHLDDAGFALNNLASLPHISVAGAVATATHGSGDRIGNLSTIVTSLQVITANGDVVDVARDRDGDTFDGVVVSLGALGMVTSLTLRLQPAFLMRQDIYEDLPLAVVAERFDEIFGSADSVSLFTEWRGPRFEQLWLKRRVVDGDGFEPPDEVFGAIRATVPIHPIKRMPADACTEQLGVPGPWHERMPHFRMDQMPSSGAELQSEFFVPRSDAVAAMLALDTVRERFAPLLQVSEVRTIAADDLWLSTAFGRDSVAIHFTWLPDWDGVLGVLPIIESALASFQPRPHWGKVFTMPAEAIASSYGKLPAFVELLRRHDPEGKFRNAFLDRTILAGDR